MQNNYQVQTAAPQAVQQPQQSPMEALKAMLAAPSVQSQFANALGDHKDAFVASLIELFSGDTQLQQCNPRDLVMQALKAATLKLPLNKALGFAYIVVYNNNVKQPDGTWLKVPTPTFIPSYKGYIQLAMRTGQYRYINADVVYEGELTSADKLTGEIKLNGHKTSNKIIGYFGYFQLLNGYSQTLYMTVEEMAAYAKRYSPSIGRNTTVEQLIAIAQADAPSKRVGWEGNFTRMAIKTVTRQLLSKGFLSVEMEGAIATDINADGQATVQSQPDDKRLQPVQQFSEVVDYEDVTQPQQSAEQPQPQPQQQPQPQAEEEGPGY